MNNARGWFAEYLVARVVGDPRPGRSEWGSYDVESREGIKIEVKISGYSTALVRRNQFHEAPGVERVPCRDTSRDLAPLV